MIEYRIKAFKENGKWGLMLEQKRHDGWNPKTRLLSGVPRKHAFNVAIQRVDYLRKVMNQAIHFEI